MPTTDISTGRQLEGCSGRLLGKLRRTARRWPVLPEGERVMLAVSGGIDSLAMAYLVCEHNRLREKVVLAKIASVRFFSEAVPGDTLTYSATIQCVHKDGAMVSATSHKGDELHAEMEVVFAHLNEQYAEKTLIDPATLVHMLRILKVYEVGRAVLHGRQVGRRAVQPLGHVLEGDAAGGADLPQVPAEGCHGAVLAGVVTRLRVGPDEDPTAFVFRWRNDHT